MTHLITPSVSVIIKGIYWDDDAIKEIDFTFNNQLFEKKELQFHYSKSQKRIKAIAEGVTIMSWDESVEVAPCHCLQTLIKMFEDNFKKFGYKF
jgi:hypothetical protein